MTFLLYGQICVPVVVAVQEDCCIAFANMLVSKLWPMGLLFDLGFVCVLIFVSAHLLCRDPSILLKVCRKIYHCKMQVKLDIGNHPLNFGKVMALFILPEQCQQRAIVLTLASGLMSASTNVKSFR